ncbi:ASCH domain-containing protein [Rhizobium laguerreae]|uniref:ASCH domain-containing protein n=1 Tax=Rhizobium laguerreae TaxID=1076926 RepID=UPI001C920598|nr:ASCH domain-containing protein [Rhizobium laguerreae]MBY3151003.1 ASCH domain-containing protein [Rhizobium laguerreae]
MTAIIPTRGLIVREPWVSLLLSGEKTWELRGSRTARRGKTALIGSGTGTVLGEADLIDVVGPLSRADIGVSVDRHRVVRDWKTEAMPYANTYAWVFERPSRYPIARPYAHPPGAVIWVKL